MNMYPIQSLALVAMSRMRVRPARIPLLAPRMLLHTGGQPVSSFYKDIFVHRAYEARVPLPPGARILDAGAHIGLAALFFLTNYPGVHVTSVEANPSTVRLLRKNLRGHEDRATIIDKALATHGGRAPFFVTSNNPVNVNAGLVNRETDHAVTRLEVDCVDVAAVIDGPFAFAKIDIEGAEYDVLTNERFNPELVATLAVELHDIHERRDDLERLLRLLLDERGYRLSEADGRPLDRETLLRRDGSSIVRLG